MVPLEFYFKISLSTSYYWKEIQNPIAETEKKKEMMAQLFWIETFPNGESVCNEKAVEPFIFTGLRGIISR